MDLKLGEPPQPVSATRADRLRRLAAWHQEWHAAQVADGVDRTVPAGRPEVSDYNVHVPDLEASASAEDEFHRRAREIMGIV
jgi:hypothetical protein